MSGLRRGLAASVRDMQNRKWACTLMGTFGAKLESSWSLVHTAVLSSPAPLLRLRPR